ncbi:MAG: DUF998 domain-containing protein [Thermoplasmata archaeon]|jgi:hypothetical membrane protein
MNTNKPPFATRSVRLGAVLLGIGVVQFVVANALVQTQYSGYSLLTNYISDLGNTATSPWHVVFNVSIAALGVLAFVAILLAWTGFPRGASRVVGLPLLLLASVAAVLVGAFPENVNPPVHDLVSLLVFAPGGLALLILSAGMGPETSWAGGRIGSALLGLVTLASLAYYIPTQSSNTTFDPGLIERLIVAPILIWGFGVAVHLSRLRMRPRFHPDATA